MPLPKSVNPDRQKVNAEVFDWELTQSNMQAVDGMEEDFVSGQASWGSVVYL